jgi:acyl-CoA reductase-like NAD-dependent aldehyde dehydrogenase
MSASILDTDLAALQEARDLLGKARVAANAFTRFTPQQAWLVAEAVSAALLPKAEFYAEWAVRETRIGKVADKVLKNRLACINTIEGWRGADLGGVRRNAALKLIEVGRPAGVIVGLSNSTSPVATIIFKSLMALMTRNAIVFSPHPIARQCCADVVRELQAAAQRAGAPADAIQMHGNPTLAATDALMRDPRCDLIVATGGTPMVRAAYASGNPTIGVGSGNVPVYIDRSADLNGLTTEARARHPVCCYWIALFWMRCVRRCSRQAHIFVTPRSLSGCRTLHGLKENLMQKLWADRPWKLRLQPVYRSHRKR